MIFDTDVLIWVLRGNAHASRAIDAATERALSIVSLMELLQSARSKLEARQIRRSLTQLGFNILPLSESIGAAAAGIVEQYALSHGIQVTDALIAATAIESGRILCTANTKHLRPIRSLSLKAFYPSV